MTLVSNDIHKAVEILNREDLVAIPTETVYGLAGNIYSEKAIKSIFHMKQRPFFNPLIVHTYSLDQLNNFVEYVPEKAKMLAQAFWPGSLTMVMKKKDIIPDLITSGKDTVAVRIPNHPLTLQLLENLEFPLAAPSANPFGCISPTQPAHVKGYFDGKLSMILDGGECENGIESTIIGFEDNEPVLYRLGSIALEDIVAVVGDVNIKNKKEIAPDAPGMLERHYAPKTTTFLVENVDDFVQEHPNKKIGVICFSQEINIPEVTFFETLSPNGDLKEATSKLYATMHKLDRMNLDMIVAQKFPDYGLGKSINDRLSRATK